MQIPVELQLISLIFSLITGGFSVAVIIVKPFRQAILRDRKTKQEEQEREEEQRETDRCVLRELIETIYYKRRASCEIYQYEYESLAFMYKQYKKLKGNSFVDRIWEEVREWTIKP